jgi:iron complex outermembrane recepter protein
LVWYGQGGQGMRGAMLSIGIQGVLPAVLGAVSVMVWGIARPADVAAVSLQAMADTGVLEEVVVSGQRAAIRRAQDIKENSVSVVDAVSAEEAGKFPDQNVADALQRVPVVRLPRCRQPGRGE